jgi:hypothetical protein
VQSDSVAKPSCRRHFHLDHCLTLAPTTMSNPRKKPKNNNKRKGNPGGPTESSNIQQEWLTSSSSDEGPFPTTKWHFVVVLEKYPLSNYIYPISISPDRMVTELRFIMKKRRPENLPSISASALRLWKVSISLTFNWRINIHG